MDNLADHYYFCGEYKVTSAISQYVSCPFNGGDDVWLEINNATAGSEISIGVVSQSGQSGFEEVIFSSLNSPVNIFKVKHHALSDYGYIKIYTTGSIDVSIAKEIPESDILSSSIGDAIVVQKEISTSNTYIEYPISTNTYYHIHLSNVTIGCNVTIGSNNVDSAGFAETFITILNATKTEYDVLIRATKNKEAFKCHATTQGVTVTLHSFKGATSACGGAKGHVACGVNVLGGESDYCVAIGSNTLHSNTGIKNIAIGNDNMGDCTGHDNTSEGYHALFRNTSGNCNSAVGSEAQDDNTTGSFNSAIGFCALQRNNTGSSNVAIGAFALNGINSDSYDPENLKSVSNNVAVGVNSLVDAESGSLNNVAIGYNALSTQKTYSNCIAIGKDADCTKDNQMVLGSSAITEIVVMGNKKLKFNNDGTVTWETI